jgi:hypothetical protein
VAAGQGVREGDAEAEGPGGGPARDPQRDPPRPGEPLVTTVRRLIGGQRHV